MPELRQKVSLTCSPDVGLSEADVDDVDALPEAVPDGLAVFTLLLDEQPARKAVTSSALVPMAASFDFFKDDAPLFIVVVCSNIVSSKRALNNSIFSVPELQNIQKVQEADDEA